MQKITIVVLKISILKVFCKINSIGNWLKLRMQRIYLNIQRLELECKSQENKIFRIH